MKKIFQKTIVALYFVLALASCSQEVKHQVLELKEYDSISIAINYPYLSNYPHLTPCVREGELYVVGYNYFEHYFDYVNLSGGKHFSVEMQREGTDGVLTPSRYWVLENGIVCQTQTGVVALDMEGKVQHRVSEKELVDPDDIYLIRPRGAAMGNYDYEGSLGSQCFIPLSPLNKEADVAIGKVYDTDTRTLELLPALYPEAVKALFQVNSLTMPRINALNADRIIYNFPYSSKVYQYDRQTQETFVMDMSSRTIANELEMKEFEISNAAEKGKKEMTTSRFDWVHYSVEADKYYRVHHSGYEDFNDMGAKRMRKTYLMVYDEKDHITKEYLLPSQFSGIYFIHDDVLYFDFDGTNDEVLTFAKIYLREL